MNNYTPELLQIWFQQYQFPQTSFSYWLDAFTKTKNNLINTWDYQWVFCIWKNNGTCITPNVNLVSNIGFDDNATHTSVQANQYANLPVFDISELYHPNINTINFKADNYIFNYWYRKRSFAERIFSRIKKIITLYVL